MKQRSIAIKLFDELMKREANSADLKKLNAILKRQYDFIETILDSTIEFVNVFDRELNFLKINARTEGAIGKPKDQIIGSNFRTLFPNELNGTYFKNLQAAAMGYTVIDSQSVAPSGKIYCTSFIPLMQSKLQYGVLVVSRDITEQIKKQQQLENANKELKSQHKLLMEILLELKTEDYKISASLQKKVDKATAVETKR